MAVHSFNVQFGVLTKIHLDSIFWFGELKIEKFIRGVRLYVGKGGCC